MVKVLVDQRSVEFWGLPVANQLPSGERVLAAGVLVGRDWRGSKEVGYAVYSGRSVVRSRRAIGRGWREELFVLIRVRKRLEINNRIVL
jgi:hypothetical protein